MRNYSLFKGVEKLGILASTWISLAYRLAMLFFFFLSQRDNRMPIIHPFTFVQSSLWTTSVVGFDETCLCIERTTPLVYTCLLIDIRNKD